MIMTLIKLGLLLLSYFGWWEFLRGRCKVNLFFAPALTLAVQFTLLFLPGLLNFLPEAAWILYLGGFGMLADALRREKLDAVKPYANWGYLLLLAALAVMALAFRGKVVTWFDNFTHWAVAAKNMLAADRFPTFAQEAVTFNTYPLGSTALIWYFCRFTSAEEDFWMLAQGFVMLSMLLPLFSFGKKNSLLSGIFLAMTGNFLLCYNIPATELLVDTLLPLAGTALLVYLSRENKDGEQDRWFALAFLFWVMNIKNAGMLYVFAGVLILLLRCGKHGESRKPVLMTVLVLLAGYLLWERHCDYVFYQNTVSQHEISVAYFEGRLGEKTLADCLQIIGMLVRTMVIRGETACVAAALAALWLLTRIFRKERLGAFGTLAGFLAVSWVVYSISLMAMYIFTMSREGAMELQSADRYIRIWEITAWYLMAAYGLELARDIKQQTAVTFVLVLGVAALWLGCCGGPLTFAQPQRNDPALRLRYEAPISEYGVAPGYSYLICAEDERVWYAAFLWAYHLDSGRILQIRVTEPEQMEAEKNFDYVVILDEKNPVIEKWVAETYPEQAGKTVIQCFK